MVSIVRDPIGSCQVGCSRTVFRLSALPQVSGTLSHALTGQDVLLIVILVLVLVGGLVIFPAVWSGKDYRRKAALDVLDRIIRWRW
jgi:hypothetical protein